MSRGRSPRDISRAEGNLEVGGDVQPNTSRFEAVYSHSLIINPSLGMYQEVHPCRANSTYSVKINTSLPMMRECVVHSFCISIAMFGLPMIRGNVYKIFQSFMPRSRKENFGETINVIARCKIREKCQCQFKYPR